MDQTAPAPYSVVRQVNQRGQDANLDRTTTIALSAIFRKGISIQHSLDTILQVLIAMLFEKTRFEQVFADLLHATQDGGSRKQSSLFD